jgi:hypothetical protein
MQFNNASIQRLYGIDAYVIAYENYHMMSSPEWEEATFGGTMDFYSSPAGQKSIWLDTGVRTGLHQGRCRCAAK